MSKKKETYTPDKRVECPNCGALIYNIDGCSECGYYGRMNRRPE